MDEGKVVAIYLYPKRGSPAVEVVEVEAVEGKGLDGDQPRHELRQVTLISLEGWRDAMDELGAELEPCARRANIVVSGMDLAATIGRMIQVGDVVLKINGETKPCQLMDEQKPGLRAALATNFRGGVYGAVVRGGRINVGDPVIALDG